ncbi:HD-GYP domain-containing protein [Anaeromyxobacter oryzisoli]|uniref:HD-GYP domain-containing protein n=1 Tax=Anaeromyxobacter oryzisoli TaxID=2925408 RepID=UPI001F5A1BF4|nr:HD domain-containing phosphohydrolase [Anaeromyxobacter sp. SG63]
MFDRLTLVEDLVDCRGHVLGRKHLVISPEAIAEVGQRAPALSRRPLAETPLVADVAAPLGAPVYAPLFERPGARAEVEAVLRAAPLPDVLVEELEALRRELPVVHQHAFATAAVAVRMLLTAVGRTRTLPSLAAGALLHDLGMRHLPRRLHARGGGPLATRDGYRIAAHPLLGAFHLAAVLGSHPAVAIARCHHWRCGQGYPGLRAPPPRAVEVIAVASAFAALTHPRPYRSSAYDARGAADVLISEATARHADRGAVKLLVHALRGGEGDPREVRFGVPRDGHAPDQNRYAPLTAPARNAL